MEDISFVCPHCGETLTLKVSAGKLKEEPVEEPEFEEEEFEEPEETTEEPEFEPEEEPEEEPEPESEDEELPSWAKKLMNGDLEDKEKRAKRKIQPNKEVRMVGTENLPF